MTGFRQTACLPACMYKGGIVSVFTVCERWGGPERLANLRGAIWAEGVTSSRGIIYADEGFAVGARTAAGLRGRGAVGREYRCRDR